MPDGTDADKQALIDKLDVLIEEIFAAQSRLKRAGQKFEDQQRAEAIAHAHEIAPLLSDIDRMGAEFNALISANPSIMRRGSRKLATGTANLVREKTSTKPRLTDHAMVMEIGRKLGVVRDIATPIQEWQLTPKKFFTWLRWHRKFRPLFEPYIFRPAAQTVWHVYPRPGYTTSSHGEPPVVPGMVTVRIQEPAPR